MTPRSRDSEASDAGARRPDPRYRRQAAYAKIGVAGQQAIRDASIAIVGVGALGSVAAERLARAGVGKLRLIDRDWVEEDNLPRQTLFTEVDAAERRPKSIAAADALRAINSSIALEAEVSEFESRNAERLAGGCDLLIDGTDNFETRFLINDLAIHTGRPWIHGGVIGTAGQVMTIVPRQTCCLRCILPEPPPAEALETCNTAGVLGPSVSIIASLQAVAALKLIVEGPRYARSEWSSVETWDLRVRTFDADPQSLRPSCPACGPAGKLDYLTGEKSSRGAVLCGRNAVQLSGGGRVDLRSLAARFGGRGEVHLTACNAFLVRLAVENLEIAVFADGRTVVTGTEDETTARRAVSQWIGL